MVANVEWHPIVRLRNGDPGDEGLGTEANGQPVTAHRENDPDGDKHLDFFCIQSRNDTNL